MDAATIYQTVNTRYSKVASQADESDAQASKSTQIAASFGYSAEDLASLPTGTNLGLSCGNPLATANLQPSENMVDLGSGGGLDCLIAARQILKGNPSPSGKIYGIDRSEAMIALARKNAAKANLPEGLVEFIQAPITEIPVKDSTVDLVVSNCVINLVPDEDKPTVFKEIHRLLKPGGRVAISDLLAKKPMPNHIRRDAALLVGCVAGASLVDEYRRWMEEAGFLKDSITFINTEKDLNVYQDADGTASCCREETGSKSCCDKNTDSACCVENNGRKPCCTKNAEPSRKLDFNEWAASYQIYAIK
ncbi:uncharacterized protein Z519_00344 [Cladophialophora bantiana CBS 173.52]|uniref:Arsenite methyltransferase n=1 Tax=Cladophialophora bantiana (strain ATCC 10958 / CBS 173.52 / CDC B-1940 / NIH 8579) TaxID=1442370 RepID=A0A0D2HYY3_CLAB1|nr:uncharacterized protein Z519_00344 [Cladophialophora bantiana CBS 173.52]KIW98683.1 hypothetical protein Z519_00344 [Cladophialophora bantiana CBS 173.52]